MSDIDLDRISIVITRFGRRCEYDPAREHRMCLAALCEYAGQIRVLCAQVERGALSWELIAEIGLLASVFPAICALVTRRNRTPEEERILREFLSRLGS